MLKLRQSSAAFWLVWLIVVLPAYSQWSHCRRPLFRLEAMRSLATRRRAQRRRPPLSG